MDGAPETFWAKAIDRVVRGERFGRSIRLGRTPTLLKQMGLGPGDLEMTAGKIARARREHPEVPLDVWHRLPDLLAAPRAVFPSHKRDGSIVVVTVAYDRDGHPIIAPITWDAARKVNVVLSLYGRSGTDRMTPEQWLDAQIQSARADLLPVFEEHGLADAEPKPDPVSEETTSWSPGMIPADRSARPRKQILTLRSKVKED